MSDLVERLRQLARQLATGDDFHNDRLLTAEDTMYWKAADRITELTRLIEHIWLHVTSDEDFSADELRRDIEKLGATDELKGAIAAREAAEAERDTAIRALRYFMEDSRFQVGVGGNPIAVDRMLAEVRAILAALSKTEGKG